MKRNRVLTILCALLSMSVLTAGMGLTAAASAAEAAEEKAAAAASDGFVAALSVTLDEQQAQSVKSLDFEGNVGQLIVMPGDVFRVEAGPKIADTMRVEVQDGVFHCSSRLQFRGLFGGWFFREEDYRIVITLPREREDYDKAEISFASGGGSVTQLRAKEVSLSGGSGSVEMEGIGAEKELEIDTGSGSAAITNVGAERFTLSLGSGSVEMAGAEAGEMEVSTASGSADLSDLNVAGALDADFNSGSVKLETVRAKEARVDTGSGGVRGEKITLGGALTLSTGSGSVHLSGDFQGLTVDGSSGKVSVEGVRGDIDAAAGSGGMSLAVAGAREDYGVTAKAGSGVMTVDGERIDRSYREDNAGKNRMELRGGSGSVRVEFEKD